MTTAPPSSKGSPELHAAVRKLLPLIFRFNRSDFVPTADQLAEFRRLTEKARDLLRREVPDFRE
jgi:hypothetical protein